MKLENLGNNKTALHYQPKRTQDSNETISIFFSYDTPVMVHDYLFSHLIITDQKYSNTTSKHVNYFKGLVHERIGNDQYDRLEVVYTSEINLRAYADGHQPIKPTNQALTHEVI